MDGEPILARVVRAFLDAGLSDVVVVLGDRADELRPILPAAARSVVNESWSSGMFSSVVCGLSAVAEGEGQVAVTPGDLAWLTAASVRRVLASASDDGVTIPLAAGRRGHPMVLPRALARRLLTWPATSRLSDLLHSPDVRVVEVPGFYDDVLRDVDTPADLEPAESRR